jgi:hypothetical protein
VWDRTKTAVKNNLRLIGIIVSLCVIGFITILIFHKGSILRALPSTIMSASNAFGLGAGIFLLCFGLVEVPRTVSGEGSIMSSLHDLVVYSPPGTTRPVKKYPLIFAQATA